jgi:hypothetical protein
MLITMPVKMPGSAAGWTGLVLLTLFYGAGFSVLFVLIPRLDMPRNAPVMNMEPVAGMLLGWLVLGQLLGPSQVLGGLIVVTQAFGYWLDIFELNYSPRGQVVGASYTDVHAQAPAYAILIVIALLCGIALILNIRFRGWRLPAIALGTWVAAAVLVGGIYPAVVQQFRVAPNEVEAESPYLERNIGPRARPSGSTRSTCAHLPPRRACSPRTSPVTTPQSPTCACGIRASWCRRTASCRASGRTTTSPTWTSTATRSTAWSSRSSSRPASSM